MAGLPKLFVSYSHKDKKWLKRLKVHLKALERDGTIDVWDDTDIKMGDVWDEEIEEGLKGAKAAILLVSADFLASDYIAHEELKVLLEAEQQGLLILMVILRPCILGKLSRFQSVNDPANPLEGMTKVEQEAVFVRLVEGVKEALIVEPASQESSPSPSRLLKVLVKQRDAPEKPPRAFLFHKEQIIIGRDSACDLPLPDYKRLISRQNAAITWKDDQLYLSDLDSINATHLNEEKIEPHQPYKIQTGDTIWIGNFEISVEILDTPSEPKAAAEVAKELEEVTVLRSNFVNPYKADVKQLVDVLRSIGEHYAEEASRRNKQALYQALRAALEREDKYEVYVLIARMLLNHTSKPGPDT